MDALTFTHHVLSDTADIREEFSIIIQQKLNIVRRAFKVPECLRDWKEGPFVRSVKQSFPQPTFIQHSPRARHYAGTRQTA